MFPGKSDNLRFTGLICWAQTLSNFAFTLHFTILGSQSQVPVQDTQCLPEGNQHWWKIT